MSIVCDSWAVIVHCSWQGRGPLCNTTSKCSGLYKGRYYPCHWGLALRGGGKWLANSCPPNFGLWASLNLASYPRVFSPDLRNIRGSLTRVQCEATRARHVFNSNIQHGQLYEWRRWYILPSKNLFNDLWLKSFGRALEVCRIFCPACQKYFFVVTVLQLGITLIFHTVVFHEITHRPALGTMRLIARKMLYVRCVGLCLRSLKNYISWP